MKVIVRGNISQFCLYLNYPSTNFNKISSAMKASWLATKKRNAIWPWKSKSRSPYIKIAVYQLLWQIFPKFYRNDGNVIGNKNLISANLENIGKVTVYKMHYK